MSNQEHFIQMSERDEVWARSRAGAGHDEAQNATPTGSRGYDSHELPGKLIEAWSRWAASRLS